MTDYVITSHGVTVRHRISLLRRLARMIRYTYGWIFVRPRRWFFRRMLANTIPHRWFYRGFDGRIKWPNMHWWFLYRTVFRYFKWLYEDSWRPMCRWSGRIRCTFPWRARVIKRIGETTVGQAISDRECYHCGHPDGKQIDLSQDDTGTTFRLEGVADIGTPDGTDHIYWGTTTCPYCGYQSHFEDGSL